MGLQHWAFVKTQSTALVPPLLQDQPFSCITHSPQNQLCPGATFPAPGAHQPSPPLLRGPLGTATAGTCSGAPSTSGHWPSPLLEKPPLLCAIYPWGQAISHRAFFLCHSSRDPVPSCQEWGQALPQPPKAATPRSQHPSGVSLQPGPPGPATLRSQHPNGVSLQGHQSHGGGYRAPALATTMPLRPLDARLLECGEAAGGPSSRDL